MAQATYDQVIEGLEPVNLVAGWDPDDLPVLLVKPKSAAAVEWINARLRVVVSQIVKDVIGHTVTVYALTQGEDLEPGEIVTVDPRTADALALQAAGVSE